MSFHAVWVRAIGGLEAFLVSLFNVKWRFSALAGGVEGSKFCLFSVVLPARCVSSASPRFHYRRHTFCFLPLAAILEPPVYYLFAYTSIHTITCTFACIYIFIINILMVSFSNFMRSCPIFQANFLQRKALNWGGEELN
jgi:hypothetical protein